MGIGLSDFTDMEELDGNDGEFRDDMGSKCKRDIVQFVEYESSVARGDFIDQIMKEIPD